MELAKPDRAAVRVRPNGSRIESGVKLPACILREPSFDACSYYFRPGGAAERTYVVEFRRAGDHGLPVDSAVGAESPRAAD